MKKLPAIFLFAATLVILGQISSNADEIILKKGKVIGVVAKTEDGRVFVNSFNSKNPRMTRGVQSYPQKQVKKIVDTRSPLQRYLDDYNELIQQNDETSISDLSSLLKSALKLKERNEAERLSFALLRRDDKNAEALAVLKPAEWARRKNANPETNIELKQRLESWFKIEDTKKRKAQLSAIRFKFGFDKSLAYMERVRRSHSQQTGRQDDRRLTLNSKIDKGVYTLFVPAHYDADKPWPLVVGLHGGGPDGKDRKDVVGSGRSAMNFYASGAAKRGYLVVCPTAIQAPWNARVNDSFVQSVLQEVGLLYNIDMNRVYLTGHSMGGFGTWHFGPRYPHLWAVVAPMAGGGFRTLSPFEKTKTPIYLYHGANDTVVRPGNSRRAADAMKGAGHDFIYTEIPDSGHGFPGDVREEMWYMFQTRRLAVAPKRAEKGKFKVTLESYSSFNQLISKEEQLYYGTLGEPLPTDKKSLLGRLKLGGGAAQIARTALIELGDKSVLAATAKLLTNKKQALDVRVPAAEVLGGLKLSKGIKPLTKALKGGDPDLVPAIATALGLIGDDSCAKALAKSLGGLDKEFDERLQGKRMAFSDWQRMLGAYESVCDALSIFGTDSTHGAIKKSAKKILLEDWEVRESDRAGLDKKVPWAPCAVSMIRALGLSGSKETNALFDKISKKLTGLAGIPEAIQEARANLK